MTDIILSSKGWHILGTSRHTLLTRVRLDIIVTQTSHVTCKSLARSSYTEMNQNSQDSQCATREGHRAAKTFAAHYTLDTTADLKEEPVLNWSSGANHFIHIRMPRCYLSASNSLTSCGSPAGLAIALPGRGGRLPTADRSASHGASTRCVGAFTWWPNPSTTPGPSTWQGNRLTQPAPLSTCVSAIVAVSGHGPCVLPSHAAHPRRIRFRISHFPM